MSSGTYPDGPPGSSGAGGPGVGPGQGPGYGGYGYGGYGGRWGGPGMMGMRRLGGQGYGGPVETKPFALTSEFWAALLTVAALAITALTAESIDARFFWTATTALVAFYMLSRGIAKSGTKSRAWDPREDMEPRRRGDEGRTE